MDEYNYWTATEDHLRANGGKVPTCPVHGTEMFAEDDHGRYKFLIVAWEHHMMFYLEDL